MENKAPVQNQNQTTTTEVAPLASERFKDMVMQQYRVLAGQQHEFTKKEQSLILGYFIVIDEMLKKSEADRVRKGKEPLPYSWNTVDLVSLAQDLAHYARIGLDMQQDNHLFPIPYKDNKNNRYTITLMEGYNGIRLQAEKYAMNPPKHVTTEVVFANDKFTAIKKGRDQVCDSYTFEIPNPFDRGKPVGAFGYIEFEDESKNALVVMSRGDIEKRKPKYASPEFWGGEKKDYQSGQMVKVEGWEPEMFLKTMKREIYSAKHIPRDPNKIDESYQYIRQREAQYATMVIENEAIVHANTVDLDIPGDPPALLDVVIQPDDPFIKDDAPPVVPDTKGKKGGKVMQEAILPDIPDEVLPFGDEPDFA